MIPTEMRSWIDTGPKVVTWSRDSVRPKQISWAVIDLTNEDSSSDDEEL